MQYSWKGNLNLHYLGNSYPKAEDMIILGLWLSAYLQFLRSPRLATGKKRITFDASLKMARQQYSWGLGLGGLTTIIRHFTTCPAEMTFSMGLSYFFQTHISYINRFIDTFELMINPIYMPLENRIIYANGWTLTVEKKPHRLQINSQ